jgi:5S rRNA maturation endonuclease (ribonuclease M5)
MRQKILSLVERYLGRGHFSGEDNISVPCPFHSTKDGTPFSVNVTNGVWQCFSCHISGPLHKLLHGLGLPRITIEAELKDIRGELEANRKRLEWKKRTQWQARDPFLADPILPETLLKPYEWCPLNLVQAGFDMQWLQWLDIGFDRAHQRVMYPIRDVYGNLAGFSGGAVIAGTHPKYKVYQGQHTDPISGKVVGSDFGIWFDEQYPTYKFSNHHYLWNFDQVYPRLFFGKEEQTLIIVEGFKACIWLLQHGYSNTVALMGSSLSDHQRNLIHRISARVVLFLDNDQAGQEATDDIAFKIRQFQPGVTIAQYPADTKQPDDLVPEELAAAITGSETYPQWKRKHRHVNGRSKKRRAEHQQWQG